MRQLTISVSIQLISPASGNKLMPEFFWQQAEAGAVSIQLISPASGNILQINEVESERLIGFHSINIPSEWEFLLLFRLACLLVNQFPFN